MAATEGTIAMTTATAAIATIAATATTTATTALTWITQFKHNQYPPSKGKYYYYIIQQLLVSDSSIDIITKGCNVTIKTKVAKK